MANDETIELPESTLSSKVDRVNHERVHFRLIKTPCCGTLLCYVNPRLPNYCSECGKQIYGAIRSRGECILISDKEAELTYAE